jgi:AAA domain/Nuclease-related domain
MPVLYYSCQPHDKEDYFSDKIYHKLKRKFADSKTNVYFLTNIGNGFNFDAVIIGDQFVRIIDYKNYTGLIVTHANKPWENHVNNQVITVKGGNDRRNPFEQLNGYRSVLRDVLKDKLDDQEKSIFDLGRIGISLIFQNQVIIEERDKEYRPNSGYYFSIADPNDLLSKITRPSKGINLSEELKIKIVSILWPDFDQQNNLDPIEYTVPIRLFKAKRVFGLPAKFIDPKLLEREKRLGFYNMVVKVENELGRLPDFKIEDEKGRLILRTHYSAESRCWIVDFDKNTAFENQLNKEITEGKNSVLLVFCGFYRGNQFYPAFFQRISFDEFEEKNIFINSNNFELNPALLSVFKGYGNNINDLFGQINNLINQKGLVHACQEIKPQIEELGIDKFEFFYSFESLGIFGVNLEREMEQIFDQKEVLEQLKTLSLYLGRDTTKIKINDDVSYYQFQNTINQSQRAAVEGILKYPINTLNGAPGTGKTYVIVETILNALYQNKTILVSSQNNQPVKVVMEKLNKLICDDYKIPGECYFWLCLGSRNNVNKAYQEMLGHIKMLRARFKEEDIVEALNKVQTGILADEQKILSYNMKLSFYQKNLNELAESQGLKQDYIQKFEELDQGIDIGQRLILESFKKDGEKIGQDYHDLWELEKKVGMPIFGSVYMLFLRKRYNLLKTNLAQRLEIPLNYSFGDLTDKYNKFSQLSVLASFYTQKITLLEEIIDQLSTKIKEEFVDIERIKKELDILNQKLCLDRVRWIVYRQMLNVLELDQQFVDKIILRESENGAYEEGSDEAAFMRKNFHRLIKVFGLAFTTNLSIGSGIPLKPEIVDYLMVDESSQCNQINAVPMIYRSKNFVVIGDPKQLPHIVDEKVVNEVEKVFRERIEDYEIDLSYRSRSLFVYTDFKRKELGIEELFLTDHHRCYPSIADYSNRNFYDNRLVIKTNLQSQGEANILKYGLFWTDIDQGYLSNNTNLEEALKVVERIKYYQSLEPVKGNNLSIGVISQYNNQVKLISRLLKDNRIKIIRKGENNLKGSVRIGTVHTFQGDECDIMIYSPVYTSKGGKDAEFVNLKQPFILNVAVTRAKKIFETVGDYKFCSLKKGTLLADLANSSEVLQGQGLKD